MLPLTASPSSSIEQAVAAPFATRQLADLGARVIKIERPGRRRLRARLRHDGQRALELFRLAEPIEGVADARSEAAGRAPTSSRGCSTRADVFVQNLAPGAADRLGTAPATCARVIRGSSSATSPATARRARTRRRRRTTCWSRARRAAVDHRHAPTRRARVGISVADIAAGMYAYSGILTALLARTTTGHGTSLDVSLFDALASGWARRRTTPATADRRRRAAGANHATIAPYGPFRAGDGGADLPRRSRTRASGRGSARDVLRQPELADDDRVSRPTRCACEHRPALHDAIAVGLRDAARPARSSSASSGAASRTRA